MPLKSFYSPDPEWCQELAEADTNFVTSHLKDRIMETDLSHKAERKELLPMLAGCLLAALLVRIPLLAGFDPDEETFYAKHIGIIVFAGLSLYLYLAGKEKNWLQGVFSLLVYALSALYINLLPEGEGSDTVLLAYIHLPLVLWSFYGLLFIGFDRKDPARRIGYIRYNGDLAILTALILITGALLSGVTIGLFSAIDMQIEDLYMENVALMGLVAAPIVGTYIIRSYPSLTNKIAPIIAAIFSPLVLFTLLIFLVAIVTSRKDPYSDREFLLIFNLMLLGVTAIIVFTVTGMSHRKRQRFSEWVLFLLSIVTLAIDLIALSAILYRLGEYGFTPNRTAVLGANLLILVNLILMTVDLWKVLFKGKEIQRVELTLARYLPIYALWTLLVTFLFPLLFGWR